MEIILRILRYVEEKGNNHPLPHPKFEGFSEEEIVYHIGLCHEAGYVHIDRQDNPRSYGSKKRLIGLTWKGHEFLDANRD